MAAYDYKKEFRDLYLPGKDPMEIDVPAMTFIAVDGRGDPNLPDGEYKKAMAILYGLSYTVKMSKMGSYRPEGYFDYVVPPLEGLWWTEEKPAPDFLDKSAFIWTAMIRQPEFVTDEVFEWAKAERSKKAPEEDLSRACLLRLTEGRCVQVMHLGPYDDEPETLERLEAFIAVRGLENAIGDRQDGKLRRHHEIYLSDPRKAAPEKMRTVLRLPVRPGRPV